MDRARLISDIKAAEGCRLCAYRDTLGYWTIGYGHKLPVGKDWTGLVWTQQEADDQLIRDIESRGIMPASKLMEWDSLDTDARQNAVCELCFNMGVGNWRAFVHTRMAITRKDWQAAHDGLLDSKWAEQVGPHRSQRLATYLLSGAF